MRYYSNLAAEMTLTASVNASQTVLSLSGVSGLPATFPFTLVVDVGTASEEVVTVTGLTGLSATVTRGSDGTSATSHGTGAKVRHMLTARDLSEPQVHIDAKTGVHGISGQVVGTTDAQVLTNKSLDGRTNNLSNVPKSALPTDTLYTGATQTLTAKTIDGGSNTLTNIGASSLPTDTVYAAATQTLTGKTMDGGSNTFTNLPATKLNGLVPKANLPTDTAYVASIPIGDEVAYTFAGGTALSHTINFPGGKFSKAPSAVVATIRTQYHNLVATLDSVPTATSCSIQVASTDGTPINGTVYVNWIALP